MNRRMREHEKILIAVVTAIVVGMCCVLFMGCGTTKEYHTHEYVVTNTTHTYISYVTTHTYNVQNTTETFITNNYYEDGDNWDLFPGVTNYYWINDMTTDDFDNLWDILKDYSPPPSYIVIPSTGGVDGMGDRE